MVVRLDDLVIRRSVLAVTRRPTLATIEAIAGIARGALSWAEARRTSEVETLTAKLRGRHALTL